MRFVQLTHTDAAGYLEHMPGNPKWDTTDGLCAIEEIIGDGAPFLVVEDDGEVLAVVVLAHEQHEHGRELCIRVAHQISRAGNLTERVLPEIERRFTDGCVSVVLRTRRAGLVAKLQRAGFAEACKIMRKKL